MTHLKDQDSVEFVTVNGGDIKILLSVCVCVRERERGRERFDTQTYTVQIRCFTCSVVSDSATPWTVACKIPLSMEFSRQEYSRGLPFPSPGNLSKSGIKSGSSALQADSYCLSHIPIHICSIYTHKNRFVYMGVLWEREKDFIHTHTCLYVQFTHI